VAGLLAVAVTGCGDDGSSRTAPPGPGRDAFASSGCFGCHRFMGDGNAGPGPDLTHVGSRLSPAQIERTLIHPTAPMPSFARFRDQNPRGFDALVRFLAGSK
jgi:ubiquinol-cytochrome c reductase cytochrome b subunit/menaquinol-cytochrome c reductase cytochrome b/c subunit